MRALSAGVIALFFQQLSIPDGKVKHAPDIFLVIDDAQAHFKGALGIGVGVVVMVDGGKKFPDQLLGGPFGFILADVDGVLGFFEGIPVLVAFFKDLALPPFAHGIENCFFTLFDLFPGKFVIHLVLLQGRLR